MFITTRRMRTARRFFSLSDSPGPLFLLLLVSSFSRCTGTSSRTTSSAPTRPKATSPSASPGAAAGDRPAPLGPACAPPGCGLDETVNFTRRCHFSWADGRAAARSSRASSPRPRPLFRETRALPLSPRSALQATHARSSCSAPTARACPATSATASRSRATCSRSRSSRRARRTRRRARCRAATARRRRARSPTTSTGRAGRSATPRPRWPPPRPTTATRPPPPPRAGALARARGAVRRGRDLDRARRRRERLRQLHGRPLQPHSRRPVGGRAALHARGGQRAARRGRRRARDRALRGRWLRQDHGQQRARDPAERTGVYAAEHAGSGGGAGGRAPRLDRGRARSCAGAASASRPGDGAHLHVRRRGRRPPETHATSACEGRRGARRARARARRSLFSSTEDVFSGAPRAPRSLACLRARRCSTRRRRRASRAAADARVRARPSRRRERRALGVRDGEATNASARTSVGPRRSAPGVAFFGPTPRATPRRRGGPGRGRGHGGRLLRSRDTPYWRPRRRKLRPAVPADDRSRATGSCRATRPSRSATTVLTLLAQNADGARDRRTRRLPEERRRRARSLADDRARGARPRRDVAHGSRSARALVRVLAASQNILAARAFSLSNLALPCSQVIDVAPPLSVDGRARMTFRGRGSRAATRSTTTAACSAEDSSSRQLLRARRSAAACRSTTTVLRRGGPTPGGDDDDTCAPPPPRRSTRSCCARRGTRSSRSSACAARGRRVRRRRDGRWQRARRRARRRRAGGRGPLLCPIGGRARPWSKGKGMLTSSLADRAFDGNLDTFWDGKGSSARASARAPEEPRRPGAPEENRGLLKRPPRSPAIARFLCARRPLPPTRTRRTTCSTTSARAPTA